MARFARVVALDTPHHVTQRGNGRSVILESDVDRLVYLDLLRRHCRLYRLSLAGYCLMSNHVHLIVIPERPDSLCRALKQTHGRYAAYFNSRHASSGHVWQGRYYSCPLDEAHFWAALRYTELNPVRAGMVEQPQEYPWSSASAHVGDGGEDSALDIEAWRQSWTAATWCQYLEDAGSGAYTYAIRQNTHTGRPLGTPEFVATWEKALGRHLMPAKGGRPSKAEIDRRQQAIGFAGT